MIRKTAAQLEPGDVIYPARESEYRSAAERRPVTVAYTVRRTHGIVAVYYGHLALQHVEAAAGHRFEVVEAAAAADADERECDRCGDVVHTLSSRDMCDGCEAEVDGLERCPNCGEWVEPSDMNHWPNLREPVSLCSSCTHNARRSGWEPGA